MAAGTSELRRTIAAIKPEGLIHEILAQADAEGSHVTAFPAPETELDTPGLAAANHAANHAANPKTVRTLTAAELTAANQRWDDMTGADNVVELNSASTKATADRPAGELTPEQQEQADRKWRQLNAATTAE